MLSPIHIILCSLAYVCLLFLVARWGGDLRESVLRRYKPALVALGTTVYCSAWAYHGMVAQTIESGWYFPPTFLGAIVLVFFFSPWIKKLAAESKRMHASSLADYLAVSYGRSRTLAVLVTLVATCALIPYIALQLDASVQSFQLLTQDDWGGVPQNSVDIALVFSLIFCVVAIGFGARHLDSHENQNGLMVAIAVDAVVKLLIFMVLAIFVATVMFDGVEDIFVEVVRSPALISAIEARRDTGHGYLTAVLLGAFAVVCLPRQFQIFALESDNNRDLVTVRWLLPMYLIVFGLCILPIAYASLLVFQGVNIGAEQFVLGLPVIVGNDALAVFTYLGGFSAASAMVVMGCIAMATMVCNELVMPLLITTKAVNFSQRDDARQLIRTIRRIVIVLLMLLAYGCYRAYTSRFALGELGLLIFALVAQFAPALFFSLLLTPARREHLARAAVWGVLSGALLWAYTLVLPSLVNQGFINPALVIDGPFGLHWLRPTALFGIDVFHPLAHSVFWSLLVNVLAFFYCSKNPSALFKETSLSPGKKASLLELRILLTRFLGVDQANLALKQYPELMTGKGPAGNDDVRIVENILSGVIGATSARHVLEHSLSGGKESEALLDKTTQIFHFGRELLQESIDNISQGISVVDAQQRLVAWNRSYLEIFHYPEGMVHVGRKISDLISYNASKKGRSDAEVKRYVDKRLKLMASGSSYVHTYTHYDGTVLEIQGARMGEGGYVTTFTDITKYKETVSALEDTRATLETRVKERTEQLQSANRKLRDANQNKTHFLAAAGHDLIQPLNAAKLFATALTHKISEPETKQLLNNLDHSLHSADTIISELLAIAKLDSGEMRVNPQTFCVGDMLNALRKDFSIIAQKKHIDLHCRYSSLAVNTDEKLLKRILQNLLSNAIRYTGKGKVLVGCRRNKHRVLIEVWDQGRGIPEVEQEAIFKEFHRLDKNMQDGGLGLGLATVQRLCELLDIKISVTSEVDKGSVFRLELQRAETRYVSRYEEDEVESSRESVLSGMQILCIDNEPAILEGMQAVLETWGCVFHGITEWQDALPWEPDALLVDYHLSDNVTGIELAEKFQQRFGTDKPVVVISADRNNDVRAQAKSRAYFFLRKPLKSASLWSVLARINDMKSLEGTVVSRH